MSITTTATQQPKDFEQRAQESFFVALCDCDESSFVYGYGCIHPFHLVTTSTSGASAKDGGDRS
ncbi:hypothetical protein [Leifsonia shinshuensis]|uniref:Uncharacterized protein n=1 Tax=Leifsonia shinshuensis TaxID=150026 RepID=A0A7G6YFP4_9MICO|nr:hypothetical protein [Leifsonia shinshuensis]QNE37309.1 hypothetical protein F1C12_20780 [Leifsonia shinshuensis]